MKSYFYKKGCFGSHMQECDKCLKIICTTHKDKCCDPNPNPNPNDNNTTPPSTTNINKIKNKPEIRRSKRITIPNKKYKDIDNQETQ